MPSNPSIAFEDFYPYIAPNAPGATDAAINLELGRALAEFLRRTQIWNEELDPVTALANTVDYALPLPTNTVAAKLLAAWRGDEPMGILTKADGRRATRGAYSVRPQAMLVGDDAVQVSPVPQAGEILTFEVVLTTTLTAQVAPECVREHMADIASGALGLLFQQPKKDWTDLEQAQIKTNRFNARISTLSMRAAVNASSLSRRYRPKPL